MKNYLTNRTNGIGFNFFDDIFDDFFKPTFYHSSASAMKKYAIAKKAKNFANIFIFPPKKL